MSDANYPGRKKLPTPEEIHVIVSAEFPDASGQCHYLCIELETVAEKLADPDLPPKKRMQLTARLAAIDSQIRNLNCPICNEQ